MAYSITSSDDSCYPGTTILVNKLGLKDQVLLDQAEEMLVSVQSARFYENAGSEPFTFSYYCAIHKHLFSKLYDWAGKLRTVELTKKGTSFCLPGDILPIGTAMFVRLTAMNEFRDVSREEFVREVTDFYHNLNMLHPFREGNGRTQRLFFSLLIECAGYHIDFSEHDPDDLMLATIYAAQGVMDHLYNFFDRAVHYMPA